MNRAVRLAVTLAVLALAAVSSAFAHEGHSHTAMGTVRTIDAARLELETENGELLRFVLGGKTEYRRGDDAATRADVQPGDRAVVRYQSRDGKHHALEVKLSPRKSD